MMKGVVEIEFIISIFVFITSISFVTFMIVGNIPIAHNNALGESTKSRSYQYADMLLLDEGYPRNWSLANEPFVNNRRIGFSTGKRNVIDTDKLLKLSSMCSDITVGYAVIKNRLGLDYVHDIVIEASRLDGSPVVGTTNVICASGLRTALRQQFQTNRLGVTTAGDIVKIRVTIIS